MSKVTITIKGDMKLCGFMTAAIRNLVDPEKTPLTKVSKTRFEEKGVSFDIESRI